MGQTEQILVHHLDHDDLALGFATFFLNRTNRSGILNGGIIGGRDQSGPWKIDARFNAHELIFRIESIAKLRNRISLSRNDALEFLGKKLDTMVDKDSDLSRSALLQKRKGLIFRLLYA